MACAFYRGGYGYCFNATPHHCARHQRCGQSPPQGHPNTTLLGFRVALRRRAGFKTITCGVTWHHVRTLSAAQKRNMGQQLQDGIRLSIVRWQELASGTPGPCVSWNNSCWMKALHDVCICQVLPQVSEGFKNSTSGLTWSHAGNNTGRGQDEAKKGEAKKGEARERPGRGREEARKRPGRGQEEDRKRTGRGRKTSGAAGGLPARPAGFRTLRKPSGRAGRGRKRYGKRGRKSCDKSSGRTGRGRKVSARCGSPPAAPEVRRPRRKSSGRAPSIRNAS